MHRITRSTTLALCGVLLAATTACGSNDAPGSASKNGSAYGDCEVSGKRGEFKLTPATAGALTVETNLPAPGWWNGDTPQTVKSGYEYCMAANIAHRAGLDRVNVKNVSFDALVAGKTKDFDLALLEITITEERKKVVDFSPPYFSADQGVLVKAGSKVDARSIRDARIGVSLGTTGALFVQEQLKPSHPAKVFQSNQDMVAALAAGQVDAVVADASILLAQAKQTGGVLKVVGQYDTGETYGALYPKGSANRATLDRIIRQMAADGTLDRLARTHLAEAFGTDPTKVPHFTLGAAS
ncbi:ABC transporter substrate-binding protein [Streptomyces vietnamensis]|uniref:ABC transporter substrate-binding protein n=1 Tax=Streptomyces vietnamensis TaxID=362257 RepID=A0A0B5HSF9_9ACTN|nr:ABC transporter substrate-binding protein [Streptomyces vietnamensis]AJF63421.1 ABC transporter substrate-binding protein [Streptomyces vietnamensis]